MRMGKNTLIPSSCNLVVTRYTDQLLCREKGKIPYHQTV